MAFSSNGLRQFTLSAALVLAGCGAEDKVRPTVSPDVGPSSTISVSPATTATTAATLVPYVGDGFTILLPAPVELEKETVQTAAGPIEANIVTAPQGDNLYGVTSADTGVRPFDLDNAARESASRAGGPLTDLRRITYKGHPGREFRVPVTKGPETATLFARAVLVKKRVYIMNAIYPGALTAPPPLYRQMVESLTFS